MLKTILIVLVLLVPTAINADKDTNKKLCEKNGGDWEDGQCDFATDDEDKVDRYLDDQQKIEEFEEEKAALEDALCDNPEDSDKFDVCQQATLAFASSDKDKKELTERDVAVLCDASEDYLAHKEQCDKLYDSLKEEQDATLAFASSSDEESKSEEEEHCEDNDGQWSKEDKTCEFDNKKDKEDYQDKKWKYFAAKPENQGYYDWEYDEEDK